ncbi:MAG: hypothetical protein NC089_03060 [Bacteroides sp.]|nr:hypothetical protein [Bacteroides sp.]MCM1549527.1 hypothetical protein [Clostridium sp.]
MEKWQEVFKDIIPEGNYQTRLLNGEEQGLIIELFDSMAKEKEYNYSEVVELTDTGIEFRDGYILKFKTCIKDWAMARKIPESENACLGCRNIAALIPYFIFFQDKVLIKIYFQYGGIFGKKRAERAFLKLQAYLNHLGYTTFDGS